MSSTHSRRRNNSGDKRYDPAQPTGTRKDRDEAAGIKRAEPSGPGGDHGGKRPRRNEDFNNRRPHRSRSVERHDGDSGNFDPTKKKFGGRCRLFIGNLTSDIDGNEVKELFKKYGELSDCFVSNKGFGFVQMDTRPHAEAAKEALDGHKLRGRPMKVRFALHSTGIIVKELSPHVSNEQLFEAFSQFGEVERAVHFADERGRPTGEGIVEFARARRSDALPEIIKRINEGVFVMGSNPRPIIVEQLEPRDEEDGIPERLMFKSLPFNKEREQGPRFAPRGTFEHEFGNRWKQLYKEEKQSRQLHEQELKLRREKLEADMDLAFQDYQAQCMREELRQRQEELERMEAMKRDQLERMKRRDEERMQQQQAISMEFGNMGPPWQRANQMGMPQDAMFSPPRDQGGFRGRGGGHRDDRRSFPNKRGGPMQEGQGAFIQPPAQERNSRWSGGQPEFASQEQMDRFGGDAPLVSKAQGHPAFVGSQMGGKGRGEDNLVHGVQKLLKMFRGGQQQPGMIEPAEEPVMNMQTQQILNPEPLIGRSPLIQASNEQQWQTGVFGGGGIAPELLASKDEVWGNKRRNRWN